jgi:hypothetical protein
MTKVAYKELQLIRDRTTLKNIFSYTGVPADMESNYPNSMVKFSNLKVGTLGSTHR